MNAWNPAEPSGTRRSGGTQRSPAEPSGTRRNPAGPGGTRRNSAEPGGNLAETWRKPGGTRRKKSKLKGGVVGSITFGMAYTPNPPLQLTFFPPGSARFPPGSARFRRVPPGSAGFRRVPPGFAGFRRVPLGSAAPLGSAMFRWVPGFRQVSSASSAVSANKVLLPTPPSIHC